MIDPNQPQPSSFASSVRIGVVVLFLIGPPLFALPAVCGWVDELFYRVPEAPFEPLAPVAESESAAHATAKPSTRNVSLDEGRSRAIQQRLQELGANYTLLEEYGDSEDVFRFVCRVDDHETGKTFEAIGPSPVGVMEQVLRDVETWTGSR